MLRDPLALDRSSNPNIITGKKNNLDEVVVGDVPNPQKNKDKESYQSNRVLQFDQPLYTKKSHTQNPILHEELELEQKRQQIENKQTLEKESVPLLTDSKPVPYYAGWDADLREFYITNRYIPKALSTKLIQLPNWDISTLAKEYKMNPKFINRESLRINFQLWPILPHDVNWTEPDSIPDEVSNKNSDEGLGGSKATPSAKQPPSKNTTPLRPYYMSVFPVEKFKDRFVDKESIIQQFGLEPELSAEEEQRINII